MRTKLSFLVLALICGAVGVAPQPVSAGCGCTKAPPDLASIRPNVTYAGSNVSIFHSGLQSGRIYSVTFCPQTGNSPCVTKTATAAQRRDLADGVYKLQLVLPLPALPLGPTVVAVERQGFGFKMPGSALTVAPQPLALPTEVGAFTVENYQAAVGSDGTVYISLDLSGVTEARSVRAQAIGYPMVFTVDDATFFNTQGFLMQLLDVNMPGLSSVESANSATDSDVLVYARHEFNTYFLQHEENQAHSIDPKDPNWHTDGTRHIDHNHQILAIAAGLYGGGNPTPGATPAFDFEVEVATMFERSLFAETTLTLDQSSLAATFDSSNGSFGQDGLFQANGLVDLNGTSQVYGVARGPVVTVEPGVTLTGGREQTDEVVHTLPVELPDYLTNLGNVVLSGSETLDLDPGSYEINTLTMSGTSRLIAKNTTGSVTLYVIGQLTMKDDATIASVDNASEKLAIYIIGSGKVTIEQSAYLYGTVYAPDAAVEIKGQSDVFGAVVGNEVKLKDSAAFYHEEALRAPPASAPADSCTDSCGGQSLSGSCYCDSLCTNYGDCCGDYQQQCAASY